MKQAWGDLKSFLTIMMTIAMVIILVFNIEVNQAVFALFSTSYGSMITFFFTKKKEGEDNVITAYKLQNNESVSELKEKMEKYIQE